ncbi:MAG: adenine phosphoribosyltransferase [Actinomycetaceae bacterium]|nr:adenine phosphoribosyltransferase [Actinomycetaceae bacterium]
MASISPLPPHLETLVSNNLRHVPDFPEPGVLFRDITPLLANGPAFQELIRCLAQHYKNHIDAVAGLESRGFLLAAPLAVELGVPMLMIRKAGKLPGPLIGMDYSLEYGTARLELQPHSVPQGARVLIVDDVLATGGTAGAAVKLIEKSGAHVAEVFVLMELKDFQGKKQMKDISCQALLEV